MSCKAQMGFVVHQEFAAPQSARFRAFRAHGQIVNSFLKSPPMLDDRSRVLLKALIERYIAEGQPVGSRTLSRAAGLDLSPATIRNVMSDLIASPHTSAGRVPTARGYRLFVDTMLTARPAKAAPDDAPAERLAEWPAECPTELPAGQPRQVIASAAQLLSSLSQFVGVVQAPRRSSVFRHIEFVRLSERRVLLIIVTPDGDVQNRVLFTEAEHTQAQLAEAANYLNAHYGGMAIEQVRERLQQEVETLRGEVAQLMHAAVQAGSEAMHQAQGDVVIAGERNLLAVSDFSSDMNQLRRAFDLFEQKTQLMRLLDTSSRAAGVRSFIGGESQTVPVEDLSVVSAPYEADGQVVGTLAVIGPTRMPYEKMIEIVDITARLVRNALNTQGCR